MSLVSFTPLQDGITGVNAAATNTPLSTIFNDYNGNITDANISASAAIAISKIAAGTGVQTYSNAGNAGGTGYYINLGGIKLCWGVTAQNNSHNSPSYNVNMPPSFFTTVQAVILTSGDLGTDTNQTVCLGGSVSSATSSFSYYSWSQANSTSATQTVSWFVVGT
jgi:hypothetical protein